MFFWHCAPDVATSLWLIVAADNNTTSSWMSPESKCAPRWTWTTSSLCTTRWVTTSTRWRTATCPTSWGTAATRVSTRLWEKSCPSLLQLLSTCRAWDSWLRTSRQILVHSSFWLLFTSKKQTNKTKNSVAISTQKFLVNLAEDSLK